MGIYFFFVKRKNNSVFTAAYTLPGKLIKCARIYERGAEMKRINRRLKMDGALENDDARWELTALGLKIRGRGELTQLPIMHQQLPCT